LELNSKTERTAVQDESKAKDQNGARPAQSAAEAPNLAMPRAPAGSRDFLDLLVPLMDAPGVARDAYRISLVANFFNGPVYADIYKQHKLLRDEVNTLFCLGHFPELTQRDICLVMGRPKNSVSRAISRLVKRGMISVAEDPQDGRRGLLTLRPAGRKLYLETRLLFVEREAKMLAGLNAAERRTLNQLLTKLMTTHKDWSDLY